MKFDREEVNAMLKGTFVELLGIEFEPDDSDTLRATMKVKPEYSQISGVMHGGVTISLAESVAGVGSNLLCEKGEFSVGIQISTNHVSSAQLGDTVIALGVLMHKGRTTHVWNVDVISATTDKLISSLRITNSILKKRW